MSTEDNLQNEPPKQDADPSSGPTDFRDGLIAREERSVSRLRWVVGTSWAAFLVLLGVTTLIEIGRHRPICGVTTDMASAVLPEYAWFLQDAIIVTELLFMLAVALTFYLHFRTRTLSIRQIQVHLAEIEKQLRKMAGGN